MVQDAESQLADPAAPQRGRGRLLQARERPPRHARRQVAAPPVDRRVAAADQRGARRDEPGRSPPVPAVRAGRRSRSIRVAAAVPARHHGRVADRRPFMAAASRGPAHGPLLRRALEPLARHPHPVPHDVGGPAQRASSAHRETSSWLDTRSTGRSTSASSRATTCARRRCRWTSASSSSPTSRPRTSRRVSAACSWFDDTSSREIIVVDNASSDGTADHHRRHGLTTSASSASAAGTGSRSTRTSARSPAPVAT